MHTHTNATPQLRIFCSQCPPPLSTTDTFCIEGEGHQKSSCTCPHRVFFLLSLSKIERTLFEETVKTLNNFYAEAEKIGGSSYLEGCLACATAYFIFLCMETRYEKVWRHNGARRISIIVVVTHWWAPSVACKFDDPIPEQTSELFTRSGPWAAISLEGGGILALCPRYDQILRCVKLQKSNGGKSAGLKHIRTARQGNRHLTFSPTVSQIANGSLPSCLSPRKEQNLVYCIYPVRKNLSIGQPLQSILPSSVFAN